MRMRKCAECESWHKLMVRVPTFEQSFASVPESAFWSDKNALSARQMFKHSGVKCWFRCDKCGHEFSNRLDAIVNGQWCQFCSHHQLCNDDACDYCFQKSFCSSNKAQCWSKKNDINPRQVRKNSNKKFLFDCNECGHEFSIAINSITRSKSQWCQYCAHRTLCENDNCQKCFENSFASSPKAEFWSLKNEILPRQLFKSGTFLAFFDCSCGHDFSSTLNNITSKNRWCPFCSNEQLCDKDECESCFEKSFAVSERAAYWSPKNQILPRMVFKNSGLNFYFKCEAGHEFSAKLNNITGGNTWCPKCAQYRTERLVREYFEKIFKCPFSKAHPSFLYRSHTGRSLELDGYNTQLKIAFEYNGIQHYKFQAHFHNPPSKFEALKAKDTWKREQCILNDVLLITIPYTYSCYNPEALYTYIEQELMRNNVFPANSPRQPTLLEYI